MGNVHNSIPTWLADVLRRDFGLTVFVETGLGQGTSALWAEAHFTGATISIEIDPKLPTRFNATHPFSQVNVLEGDSSKIMPDVVACLVSPAMFWLDGHTDDFCPVLSELAAINTSPIEGHIILMDDARLFGALPAWPTSEQVIEAAQNNGRRATFVIDDVIVAVPRSIMGKVAKIVARH